MNPLVANFSFTLQLDLNIAVSAEKEPPTSITINGCLQNLEVLRQACEYLPSQLTRLSIHFVWFLWEGEPRRDCIPLWN